MCMRHDVTPMNIMNENENDRNTRKEQENFAISLPVVSPSLFASEAVNHEAQKQPHRLNKREFLMTTTMMIQNCLL